MILDRNLLRNEQRAFDVKKLNNDRVRNYIDEIMRINVKKLQINNELKSR